MMLQTVVLEKTLESPLDGKEIKPVNLKGNQPEYSLGGLVLKLKLQYFDHLIDTANSLEKSPMLGNTECRRRGHQGMRGWRHRCNRRELGQISGDGEGQGGLVCCRPWCRKELDTTG